MFAKIWGNNCGRYTFVTLGRFSGNQCSFLVPSVNNRNDDKSRPRILHSQSCQRVLQECSVWIFRNLISNQLLEATHQPICLFPIPLSPPKCSYFDPQSPQLFPFYFPKRPRSTSISPKMSYFVPNCHYFFPKTKETSSPGRINLDSSGGPSPGVFQRHPGRRKGPPLALAAAGGGGVQQRPRCFEKRGFGEEFFKVYF